MATVLYNLPFLRHLGKHVCTVGQDALVQGAALRDDLLIGELKGTKTWDLA